MCGHARMSRKKAESDVNGDFYFYLFIIDLFFVKKGNYFLFKCVACVCAHAW